MISRTLTDKLLKSADSYPVVTLTGPRQSGKTTLVREACKNHEYISLELPDNLALANEDPKGFLNNFKKDLILDEIQRIPKLFSYIQVAVDEDPKPGKYILTGSQNFLLMQKITQSLAGRCSVLHLLPLSLSELEKRSPLSIENLDTDTHDDPKKTKRLEDVLFTGFYPRIHAQNLDPNDWLGNYYQTYLERDVRNILNIGDIEAFGRFVLLCAGRNGQLLNLSSLASDCGISHTTAKRWLSILEASFIVFLLRPYFKNLNKRLIKSPKLYFLDSGLLCYLLRINKSEQIFQHPMRGQIFESLIISEIYKNFTNRGERPPLYFFRDSKNLEIDLIIDFGSKIIPIEIKSSQTISEDFFKPINRWKTLHGEPEMLSTIIYGGDRIYKNKGTICYPWFYL